MDTVLTPRDRAYLDILHFGLVFLRNATRAGRTEFCAVESEHLHEVPTLVGEANESRHEFYLRATRRLYLDALRTIGDEAYLEQASTWYSDAWRILAEAAGMELADRGVRPRSGS